MFPINFHTLARRACCTLALVVTALLGVTAAADAADSTRPAGMPASKRAHKLSIGDSRDTIDVKFAEGTDVRRRGNHFVSKSNGSIAALDEVLARFPGLKVSRLFRSASEEQLAVSERQARARSGREQADLNLYFRIETEKGSDTIELIDALNALDIVEAAAPASKPVPLPATPSFVDRQGYRTAGSSGGIDADYAQTLTGGKGEHVRIVDIEYGWNRSHEDLAKARVAGSALANGTPCDPFAGSQGVHSTDHGTAVLGELAGDSNGSGVTGLAPSASLYTVNAARKNPAGGCELHLANAINVAHSNTSAGDVILIEQQGSGPNRTNPNSGVGYVPVEWDRAVFDAIKTATSSGKIVIEPAGNGYQNLDDAVYRDLFSIDSGAIMVGAGNAPGCTWGSDPIVARGRLSFSNYGGRLNVQGWGDCVTTTGYGDLQGGTNSNAWYTKQFSGTSSASPIVAASAAVLSSIAESRGTTLKPATVRSLLRSTGQPQAYGNGGSIGPLPNLKAAINALGPKLAESAHVVSGANLGATTVPVRQSWTSSGSAAARYDVWLSKDGGNYVQQTLSAPTSAAAVFQLERGHDYQFAARAVDADGVWGAWAFGTKFSLGEYQEDYTATNPAYTGTWTRPAWQPASDGYLRVSGTAGAKATFSFTGSNVAWIATKSANRGQANVYVDGSFVKTVDLYSPTPSAQAIAFSHSWSQVGPHTIEVRVVGTAGRPKVDVDAFVRLR